MIKLLIIISIIITFLDAGKPSRLYVREGILPNYDELNTNSNYVEIYKITVEDFLAMIPENDFSLTIGNLLKEKLDFDYDNYQRKVFENIFPITKIWRNNAYLKEYLEIIEVLSIDVEIRIIAFADHETQQLFVCGLADDKVTFQFEVLKRAGEEEDNTELDKKEDKSLHPTYTNDELKNIDDFRTSEDLFNSLGIIALSESSGGVGFDDQLEQDIVEHEDKAGDLSDLDQAANTNINKGIDDEVDIVTDLSKKKDNNSQNNNGGKDKDSNIELDINGNRLASDITSDKVYQNKKRDNEYGEDEDKDNQGDKGWDKNGNELPSDRTLDRGDKIIKFAEEENKEKEEEEEEDQKSLLKEINNPPPSQRIKSFVKEFKTYLSRFLLLLRI